MATLYELNEEMRNIEAALEDIGDEPSEQLVAQIEEWKHGLEAQLSDKMDNYVALIRELQARQSARQQEADRLAALAATDRRRWEWLLSTLQGVMTERGYTHLDLPRFAVTLCFNGGKIPIEIDDAGVTADWRIQPPAVPDTKTIRDALEGGTALEFARLLSRGQHVRIR